MKFKIEFSEGEIHDIIDEIQEAIASGAEDLFLIIEGDVNRTGKVKNINIDLSGSCFQEYHATIYHKQ